MTRLSGTSTGPLSSSLPKHYWFGTFWLLIAMKRVVHEIKNCVHVFENGFSYSTFTCLRMAFTYMRKPVHVFWENPVEKVQKILLKISTAPRTVCGIISHDENRWVCILNSPLKWRARCCSTGLCRFCTQSITASELVFDSVKDGLSCWGKEFFISRLSWEGFSVMTDWREEKRALRWIVWV